jgi:hypothetical protein
VLYRIASEIRKETDVAGTGKASKASRGAAAAAADDEEGENGGRGLHSSTFQLNLSRF